MEKTAPEEYIDQKNFKPKKTKVKFNKKLEKVEGKCTFKLPLKPRLCYQLVNAKDSTKFCRFHLDQELKEDDMNDPMKETHQN